MISRVVLEDERANKPTSRSIRAAVRAGKLPKITKRKRDDQVEGSIQYEVPVESEDDASSKTHHLLLKQTVLCVKEHC